MVSIAIVLLCGAVLTAGLVVFELIKIGLAEERNHRAKQQINSDRPVSGSKEGEQ